MRIPNLNHKYLYLLIGQYRSLFATLPHSTPGLVHLTVVVWGVLYVYL
jgi:hypothetical protein